MNRYQKIKQLGDGTYGSVILGRATDTGEMVAIKKMKKKFYSWEECMNLREVKSLKKLNHANVIKLKEVIRENDQLFFIFEYMKENLYQLIKDRERLLPEAFIRNTIYQVLQGMAFIHKNGFFHRDMKPENLLVSGQNGELLKIADFGLARETRSKPPYTDYVSTRWYRAPEVLLRSTNYSSPIDIWAIGAIMGELYNLRPLFPGTSEVDQIFKVCAVLGTVKKNDWPEGYQLATAINFKFPQCAPIPFKQLVPSAGSEGLQMLKDMLQWNPQKRPSAKQCLRYPFFQTMIQVRQQPQQQQQQQMSQYHNTTQQQQQNTDNTMNSLQYNQQEQFTVPQQQHNTQQQQQQPSLLMHRDKISQVGGGVQQTEIPTNRREGLPSITATRITQQLPPQSQQPVQTNTQPPKETFYMQSGKAQPSGRRRWGNAPVVTGNGPAVGGQPTVKNSTTDLIDDLDDFDFSMSFTANKKPVDKKRSVDLDSIFGEEISSSKNPRTLLPKVAPQPIQNQQQSILPSRLDSGRSSVASAKQHYLRQSRYLPGINPGKSGKGYAGSNENTYPTSRYTYPATNTLINTKPTAATLSLVNRNTNQPGGFGSDFPPGGGRRDSGLFPSNPGTYVPSFQKKDGSATRLGGGFNTTGINAANSNYSNWKTNRTQAGSIYAGGNKPANSAAGIRQPLQPVHGRTDWQAKYGTR